MLLGQEPDSSKLEDAERGTFQCLQRLVETGHLEQLNADETEMLKRALNWYGMWESTFNLLASVRNTAILIGFLMTFWVATEGTILDFIRGLGK